MLEGIVYLEVRNFGSTETVVNWAAQDYTCIDPRPHTHHADYQFGPTYYTPKPWGVVETCRFILSF